ncbi:MAG TPA: HIT domain-containing protein [Terriglobales bacterium]|nr:HIT domain-containing protein [Terriglobales bacterium]
MNSHRAANITCEFCDEFAGGSANSFAAHYAHELESRTILEQENFRVLPTLGQIVPGYLLLVPNHHYRAFADMSLEELKAAEVLKTSLTEQMRVMYGNYLFFEHGVRTSDSGGCGISHAHLHAVPFPHEKDPVEELARSFSFEKISSLLELKRVEPDRSYLYYESVRGIKYVLYPPFIPSQYIRRLLAEALGNRAWDWRQCKREERFLSTLSQVSQLLSVAPR